MQQPSAMKVVWKLHTVMSDRGIRTVTELHRRLEPYGIGITCHQLTRIVAKLPARLNTKVLEALLLELNCDAADLFQWVSVASEPADPLPGTEPPGK
jgi:DNA-binding Xre family transcriptional regulator